MGLIIIAIIVILFVAMLNYMRKNAMKAIDAEQADSKYIIELTDANFNDQTKEGVFVVDFWASWCKPCKMQNPVINQIAEELIGKARVGKVNVDENKETTRRMGIKNIPCIIIYKKGEAMEKIVGITPKQSILRKIKQYIED